MVDNKKSPEIAKSPPTLTAAVVQIPKMTKKEELKAKNNEIFTTATTTEDEDDDDDDDNPPSEKKLKIDLENHDTFRVTANDVKKVEKSVKKVEKSDIKLKVMANDHVKKVEKLAGNSNPIVKSEKKPEIVKVPSSVKKEEVVVMDQKKPIQKLVMDQKKPIQKIVMDQKKTIQTTGGINGTTTTNLNSVKLTNNSPKSPIIQQELVVKPKLTNGSSAAKSRDGNNKKLYDIVNNLSKKQASLNNSPQQPGKKDSSIGK